MRRAWLIPVLIALAILGYVFSFSYPPLSYPESDRYVEELKPVDKVEIVVVVDNNRGSGNLISVWGISLFVKADDVSFLFDTGPDPEVLEHNVNILKIDVGDIDFIVISHEHGDHVGGMPYLERVKPGITVYVPRGMDMKTVNYLMKNFKVIEVERPKVIARGVVSSGPLYGGVYEQAVAIYVKNRGLVILTGCSHPRVEYIVSFFHNITELPIYAVIGGFHLSGAEMERLEKIANVFLSLDVKMVYPIHCTGDVAREFFSKSLGSRYKDGHVGIKVEIEE